MRYEFVFSFVCLLNYTRNDESGQSGAVRFTADLGKFCELPEPS